MRTKKRKKLIRMERKRMPAPLGLNQMWAMDFVSDALADGRKLRCLTVEDLCTRESVAIRCEPSLPAVRVVEALERAGQERGYPLFIRVDNGPEFRGTVLEAWAHARGVRLDFTQPGKPTQNGHIESFNGKFRDECLNLHWFTSLRHAQRVIEEWRRDYNEFRPHSGLGNQTPSEAAAKFAACPVRVPAQDTLEQEAPLCHPENTNPIGLVLQLD